MTGEHSGGNWLLDYVRAIRETEGRLPNKADRRPTEAEWRRRHRGEKRKRYTSPPPGGTP